MADVKMQYSLWNLYLAQQILSRFFHIIERALNFVYLHAVFECRFILVVGVSHRIE